MKFNSLLLSSLLLTPFVFATPPACFLQCINEYARWCPNAHTDIKCFFENKNVMISCFQSRCPISHLNSARDHFLGVCMELLESPTMTTTALPGPTSTPIKHKPPKYGYRNSRSTLVPVITTTPGERVEEITITETYVEEIVPTSTTTALLDIKEPKEDTVEEPMEETAPDSTQDTLQDIFEDTVPDAMPESIQDSFEEGSYYTEASQDQLATEEHNIENTDFELPDKTFEDAEVFNKGFQLHKKPHGFKPNLPNFSRKKLLDRITTDEGLSKSKIKSKFADK